MANPSVPLVSIALCSYNGERYLEQQLDTLLAQEYSNIEILAQDDCSTDSSFAILQRRAREDARLRPFRNQENIGLLRNFETCARRCNGELVAFSDQDDLWHPAKIRRLVETLRPADMAVYCDSELVDEQGRSMGKKVSERWNMYEGKDPLAFVFANCVSGHALLIRKELLSLAAPFPSQGLHDWWLAFAAAANGGIRYLPEALVQFRQHLGSQTDMGQLSGKPHADQQKKYQESLYWLAHLSQCEIPQRAYLELLFQAWRQRASRRLVPACPMLLSRHAHALTFIQRTGPLYPWLFCFRSLFGIPQGLRPAGTASEQGR